MEKDFINLDTTKTLAGATFIVVATTTAFLKIFPGINSIRTAALCSVLTSFFGTFSIDQNSSVLPIGSQVFVMVINAILIFNAAIGSNELIIQSQKKPQPENFSTKKDKTKNDIKPFFKSWFK